MANEFKRFCFPTTPSGLIVSDKLGWCSKDVEPPEPPEDFDCHKVNLRYSGGDYLDIITPEPFGRINDYLLRGPEKLIENIKLNQFTGMDSLSTHKNKLPTRDQVKIGLSNAGLPEDDLDAYSEDISIDLTLAVIKLTNSIGNDEIRDTDAPKLDGSTIDIETNVGTYKLTFDYQGYTEETNLGVTRVYHTTTIIISLDGEVINELNWESSAGWPNFIRIQTLNYLGFHEGKYYLNGGNLSFSFGDYGGVNDEGFMEPPLFMLGGFNEFIQPPEIGEGIDFKFKFNFTSDTESRIDVITETVKTPDWDFDYYTHKVVNGFEDLGINCEGEVVFIPEWLLYQGGD